MGDEHLGAPGCYLCINHKKSNIMSNKPYRKDDDARRRTKRNIWLSIGAAVLILLVLWWMFVAIASGDTDVAAFVTPLI